MTEFGQGKHEKPPLGEIAACLIYPVCNELVLNSAILVDCKITSGIT